MSKATDLRRAILAQGDLDFEFWVRLSDRFAWVGAVYGSRSRCDILMDRLRRLGYTPIMTGKPGTAGEWIIDVPELMQPSREREPRQRPMSRRRRLNMV